MEKELISIIIPVFNREKLIAESLDSILQQTYRNWECIIVDDHSTDGTLDVVQKYVLRDERFKFYRRPASKNKGANSCRNYGFDRARGEYIHWFDSDDIAHPECLNISKIQLQKYGLSFCRFNRRVFFGEFTNEFNKYDQKSLKTHLVGKHDLEAMLTNELEFNTCNVLWKRAAINGEGFNEDIIYADEWEFYSRLLAKGLKGISLDCILFYGRKHSASTTFEYLSANRERRNSKIKATLLVIKNLKEKDLLSNSLTDYFIKLGFFLKSRSVIKLALESSKASIVEKWKYYLGYEIYPILRPLFKVKGKVRDLFF